MSKLRVLVGAALTASLAIGVLAAPASAAPDPRVVIGHGIPRAVVDICVRDLIKGGGQVEAISDFKYGGVVKTSLPAGTYRFITREAKDGNCNGKKLIVAEATLAEGDDISVIATRTRGVPTYQVFDNRPNLVVGTEPSFIGSYLSVKHAAMIGKADVWIIPVITVGTPAPTLSGVPKGAEADLGFGLTSVRVGVGKTGGVILKTTPFWEIKPDKVNHVVAVGTKDNLRFLRYRTPISID